MTLGFVMLVHDALHRAAEVARYWAERGCPVVIHADRRVSDAAYGDLKARLDDLTNVRFMRRYRCEWGTWSLVAASQAGAETMLAAFPQVQHVYLASGSCLPLRPVSELSAYLARHPDTDFIESVTIDDVRWTMGGLDLERFTLHFPFAWRRQRFLFDQAVGVQRWLGVSRQIPEGLTPHLGSQWWCLTRATLTAIFEAPERRRLERFFGRVWIPDESYFQTVVRRHARRIESRSLTLSKFDFQGKPHILFDDHLQLLRRSDCFVARKVWPGADMLYRTFLSDALPPGNAAEPNPGKVDRVFTKAVHRRTRGRPGLSMPGRFPDPRWITERTAAPYWVYSGLAEVFEDFAPWLEEATEMRVHGHLFAPERAEFFDGQSSYAGGLSDNPKLRDYDPRAFLRNLIWSTRGERQGFMFGPADNQEIGWFLIEDANARITLVTGAWAVRLFRTLREPSVARDVAARLQQREAAFMDVLRRLDARAQIRVLTLAELLEQPMEILQQILEDAGATGGQALTPVPRMVDLTGFDGFLQALKNEGMNPYLVGDFHSVFETGANAVHPHKPYLVR